MGRWGDRENKGNKGEMSKQQTTNNKRQTTISFEVEDTGPGVAPEEMEKLFTAFGQTETGRKLHQGTGLGLVISQTIVELMGGQIAVSSTPKQGTTFTFDIQVTLAKATDIQTSSQARKVIGLAANQSEYRILVVDDSPESRLFLVKLLKSVGFSVREAENGQEAIAMWSSYSPHLILMDMRMPVMNGYKATNHIKAREREIERWEDGETMNKFTNNEQQTTNTIIIALTASVFEEERTAVLSAGCDDFMSKPFREELLWEKFAQHLGVRYLYEDSMNKSQDEEIQGKLMTFVNQSLDCYLSSMPKEWVENLNQAALKCRDYEIIQLVEQIPEIHSPLANTLRNWANNFLFDQVIELIQRAQVIA